MIIGLNEQKRKLEKILLEFKEGGLGGSCLLLGRRQSGKSLVLEQVKSKIFPTNTDALRIIDVDGEECSFVASTKILQKHGLDLGNNSQIIDGQCVGKTKDSVSKAIVTRILFVIDHYEVFATKNNQIFLYSLLNGCQTRPWFVLLVGSTENCLSILEKRVRSRLYKNCIYFDAQFPLEEFREGFFKLIKRTNIPKSVVENLEKNSSVGKLLCNLHARSGMIALLKKLVELYEKVFAKFSKRFDPFQLFNNCCEALLGEQDQYKQLQKLSPRQLILLHCLSRLEENRHQYEFSFHEVLIEYLRFCNEVMPAMRVADVVLFRDLQELVVSGLVVQEKKVNSAQLSHRRIILNVEHEAILRCLDVQKLPSQIVDWFRLF